MPSDYISGLRDSRNSRSVLKLRLVTLRSQCPDCPLLIFEGDDDKIIYGRWIGRIRSDLDYVSFVCKGKRIVSTVQKIINEDRGSLRRGSFLFIDRDFDDGADFERTDELFMTDQYSVENYLVTSVVLRGLLRDEFPCHELPDLVQNVVDQFEKDYANFLDYTKELNRRLFIYRRSNVDPPRSMPDKIAQLCSVEVGAVRQTACDVDSIFPAIHAIPQKLDVSLRAEFDELDPPSRYRGKNSLLFFMRWLDLLANCYEKNCGIFARNELTGRVRRQEFTLGTFASKSSFPLGLPEFVSRIAM